MTSKFDEAVQKVCRLRQPDARRCRAGVCRQEMYNRVGCPAIVEAVRSEFRTPNEAMLYAYITNTERVGVVPDDGPEILKAAISDWQAMIDAVESEEG